jgi:hypothetical protein
MATDLLRAEANNLAARRTLQPARVSGPGKEETILQLRGNDRDAEEMNIVIAPVLREPARAPVLHPCIAVIEWGTGGASARAEVDFARGTTLQLAASFLSIGGRNDGRVSDGTPTGVIDPAPGPQDVIAMIAGAGGRVAFGPATRTFYFGNVLPATPLRLAPVPAFAKAAVITRSPADTSIEVVVFDGIVGTDEFGGIIFGPQRDQYTFANVPAARFALYERAGVVGISNAGTVPITSLQVTYELCL